MSNLVNSATSDDGDDWDTKIDHQYMKLLDSFREDGTSNLRDNPLRSIRYEVDNGGYDIRKFKATVTVNRRRKDQDMTKKNVHVHVQGSEKKTTTREANFELRQRESLVTEKENSDDDDDMVLDETYRSYLTWLVEKSKSSRRSNHEKEIKVKCEEDIMSLSDSDSDVIVIGDRPFLDEEDSPFVPSKCYKVIDLDDESGDQSNSWFRKEIMNVLKQPYSEEKLKELHIEASERRPLTRYKELRDGRDFSYKTKETTPSYLDVYPDFKSMYRKSLCEKDPHKALNLLRGFIFYLTNVARDDAFKPWLDNECLNIT